VTQNIHQEESQGESAAGFILAGGQSSRMGSDKALALFGGVPLIQIALNTLAATGIPVRIAGSRSPLQAFAPTIPTIPEIILDTFPSAGPLGGVHAALSASSAEWNLFLPVDIPLMPSSLLACLLQRATLTGAPVAVVRLNGRIQPFPVVLHRTALPGITQRLQAGNFACHAAWQTIPPSLGSSVDSVPVEYLLQCGHCQHPLGLPPFLWFQRANTPAELSRLTRYARQ
jgi:molybdopterin-guanine dinucleotide biosynthesis protein A